MLNHYVQTILHKFWVFWYLLKFCCALIRRGLVHDNSKLSPLEAIHFSSHLKDLRHTTFGSKEYNQMLEDLKPALNHHYQVNDHHPQHHQKGVHGMNLEQFVEMYCDWCASCRRHSDGDIHKSIDISETRFTMDHELTEVLHNQADTDGYPNREK